MRVTWYSKVHFRWGSREHQATITIQPLPLIFDLIFLIDKMSDHNEVSRKQREMFRMSYRAIHLPNHDSSSKKGADHHQISNIFFILPSIKIAHTVWTFQLKFYQGESNKHAQRAFWRITMELLIKSWPLCSLLHCLVPALLDSWVQPHVNTPSIAFASPLNLMTHRNAILRLIQFAWSMRNTHQMNVWR